MIDFAEADRRFFRVASVLLLVTILLLVVNAVVQSRVEARVFNQLTGQNLSVWDAFWLDLQIPAPQQQSEGVRHE